jgi:hypothetical protein
VSTRIHEKNKDSIFIREEYRMYLAMQNKTTAEQITDSFRQFLKIFDVKENSEEDKLCNLILKSAYADIKAEKSTPKAPKFIPSSYTKTENLQKTMLEYVKNNTKLEPTQQEQIATNLTKTLSGSYSELKSQLDYISITGVDKNPTEIAKAVAGMSYRALKMAGSVISNLMGYKSKNIAEPKADIAQTKENLKKQVGKALKGLKGVETDKEIIKSTPKKDTKSDDWTGPDNPYERVV